MLENFYFDSFIEMLIAEKGLGKLTIEAYRSDLKDYVHYLGAHKVRIKNSKEEHVEKYIQQLAKQQFSASSISRKLSTIKGYYKFLFEEGYIEDNIAYYCRPPKKAKKLPKLLHEEEIESLLKALQQMEEKEQIRLRAIVELLYATGLRVSELVSLPHNITRENQNYIVVLGKGQKERMVPLHEQSIQAVYAYMQIRTSYIPRYQKKNPYLFPSSSKEGHITRQRVGQLLKELAIKANLDPARVSPHVLRHAFATHLLQNGANLRALQMMLGHEDISTTEIYTHVAIDKMKKMLEEKHPLQDQ